ncbi:pseudouridine synthase [Nocardioides marmoraquaticus]
MSREIEVDDEGLVRLQKLLAQSGVASRRKCEELMLDGLVEVDGEVVTRLGTKVDPRTAVVKVDGRRLPPVSDHVYLVLNKPRGVVSTMSDPEGRRSLGDLVAAARPARPERLFHVGRLDTDTDGLILLTNDGDFAQRLAHPSYEVAKTYVAEVDGVPDKAVLQRLRDGVTLDDGGVTVERVKVVTRSPEHDRAVVELVIHEGRNRIVRRLLEHVGHPVRRLTRTAIGPVVLRQLRRGEMRELSQDELGSLLEAGGL